MNTLVKKKVLYYVTGRASKASLFAHFLPANVSFSIEQVHRDLFEEQTDDQEKIALSKAYQAWDVVRKPVLVDDGGIYFHKYHDFPGTVTKFVYKGLGYEGICKLLDEGDELSVAVSTVLMYGPDLYKIFRVVKKGTFKKVDNPDTHFLFDSTFVPEGLDKTYVELKEYPALYEEYYFPSDAAKQVAKFVEDHPEVFSQDGSK